MAPAVLGSSASMSSDGGHGLRHSGRRTGSSWRATGWRRGRLHAVVDSPPPELLAGPSRGSSGTVTG